MGVTRFYIIGVFILIGAILANFLAAKLYLKSWYDIFEGLSKNTNYWGQIRIMDGIWLIIIYPLFLGFSAYIGSLFNQKLL